MIAPAPQTLILFSTADWNAPYWTNKQHVAQRLARRGTRVLYLESPGLRTPKIDTRDVKRIAARLGRVFRRVRRVEENIWVVSPLNVPVGRGMRFIDRLNGWLLRGTIRRWLKRYGRGEAVVWTYHPYIDEALEGLSPGRLVYHCVDDIAAIPGVDGKSFSQAESRLLSRADCVFATSRRLQEHCAATAGPRAIYERNVADIEHFAAARLLQGEPQDLRGIPHPRIAYIGVLADYKLDLELIEGCMIARPDWQWIFIGDEPEGNADCGIARLKRMPNAHFLGYKSYAELPGYLAAIDVAALPVLVHGYMASVFPMKLYEYLASGKPVLATSLAALEDVRDMIHIASGVAQWLEAMEFLAANPPKPIAIRDPRLAEYSWDARLDRMLKHLSSS
jgi:glycosyltransferase involved in cell wall biosynthesis